MAVNWFRVKWALGYWTLGGLGLALFLLMNKWQIDLFGFLWSGAFSCFGIGVWLINTRDHSNEEDLKWDHYLLYFGFSLILATLGSFSAAIISANEPHALLRFYSVSAFAGLGFGFSSERLTEWLPIKGG